MKLAVLHPDAEAELTTARDWYERQRLGLGDDLVAEVRRAVERIVKSPHAFSPYGRLGMRMHFVRRFPYTIYYLELDDCIWIAAVAHQRRRPGYWKKRKPD